MLIKIFVYQICVELFFNNFFFQMEPHLHGPHHNFLLLFIFDLLLDLLNRVYRRLCWHFLTRDVSWLYSDYRFVFLDHGFNITPPHSFKHLSKFIAELLFQKIFIVVCNLVSKFIGLAWRSVPKLSMNRIILLEIYNTTSFPLIFWWFSFCYEIFIIDIWRLVKVI